MRKLLSLLILALVFVACQSAPQPTATPAPIPPGESSPIPEPTDPPTEVPTEVPADPTSEPEPTPTETVQAEDPPIYLAIIWHQHQPVYYKNPETNSYVRPWVRVHATKDYVDMAATVAEYPDIHVTFNLTPSLLRQIEDLSNGATDEYMRLALIPADELTLEEQAFILERFFDTNRNIIQRFPRYQELLEKRDAGEAYTTDDFRDLQILFNLAWTDPDWLAEEPLAGLVSQVRDYTEEDKTVLFEEHMRLVRETIPIHKEMQDNGQIEVTMTPYAHPILPLLVDTESAKIALPDIELPQRFIFGQDAQKQVELGVELYEELFGVAPKGMWPAEGSVSQQIVTMVARNGITWMASDEGVLANSLGFESFTRDSTDLVQEADILYRPYYVEGTRGGPVAMVYRDVVISDKVGFTYSGMNGSTAALDFTNRILDIRQSLIDSGAEGPHLVSVILDGENAWEFYENDGKEFLHQLYTNLSQEERIVTVTPTEFLEIAPEQPAIDELWAGSWINHDFSTWIGEKEENDAWNLLLETRLFVREFETGQAEPPSEEALERALDLMYIAEGSDWFWWYGSDQTSGNDDTFDLQFRETIKEIYVTLGEEPPQAANVPIIPLGAATLDQAATDLLSPTIDSIVEEGEWDAAGTYNPEGGVMQAASNYIDSLSYGFDSDYLYVLAELGELAYAPDTAQQVDFYLNVPGIGETNSFSDREWLGFQANRWISVDLFNQINVFSANGDETWTPVFQDQFEDDARIQAVVGNGVIEMAIPLDQLGGADVGDKLSLRAAYNLVAGDRFANGQFLPTSGPAVIGVPDLGNLTVVLEVDDPEGDDHGPGSYDYPKDEVFASGNFDIIGFTAGYDEESIIFKFDIRGPINNHWDSPNGLSGISLDIYIDQDGDGQGGTALFPGRNLSLQEGFAWDYGIHVEGWTSAVYEPGDGDIVRIAESSSFDVVTDPGQRKVTVKVPKSIIGDDPENWRFAAMSMGQEGFPSGGVMRIRDIAPTAEQWRFGGAPNGATNHTRVIDLVWAVEGEQEGFLSDFTTVDTPQTEQTAADYATIPMLQP